VQLLISNEQRQIEVGEELLGLIKKALEEVLKEEEFFLEPEVSLLLVDDTRMSELNRQYRGRAATTDVLSFPMLEENLQESEPEVPDPGGEILLGDIVISVPRAREQALAYGNSFSQEMVFLAVHGMLHLLGYDHEAPEEAVAMRAREKRVLARAGFKVESNG